MIIEIIRNKRLIDGETYYDDIIEIETEKHCSFSLIKAYDVQTNEKTIIGYLQIGNFLNKDFEEYEIYKHDIVIFGEQ